MAATEAERLPCAREGRIPELWTKAVLWSLALALYLTFKDLLAFQRAVGTGGPFLPNPLAWQLFFWAQVANKLPVSYRYQARGLLMAADLLGFAAGMAAAALFGLRVPVPPAGAVALAVSIGAWIGFGVWRGVFRPERPRSLSNRIFCAGFASLLPSLPMLGAALALCLAA